MRQQVTKKDQIKNDIMNKIVSREYHRMLPSLKVLAKTHGVNIKTVQKAIEGLQGSGIIECIPGAGSFIRNPEALQGIQLFKAGMVIGAENRETPYYHTVGDHICQLGGEYNCNISSIFTKIDKDAFKDAILHLRRGGLDGFIIGPGTFDIENEELNELTGGLPFVVLHGKPGNYNNITVNLTVGLNNLLNYFIDQGHTRIACLKSKRGEDRYQAYRNILKIRGIPFCQELIVECDGGQISAYQAVSQFIDKKIPFSAIMAHNDPCALGAYYALQQAELRVPEDVSISGVDNIKEARKLTPPLTTVSNKPEVIARKALEMLNNIMSGQKAAYPPENIEINSVLIIRDSVIKKQ